MEAYLRTLARLRTLEVNGVLLRRRLCRRILLSVKERISSRRCKGSSRSRRGGRRNNTSTWDGSLRSAVVTELVLFLSRFWVCLFSSQGNVVARVIYGSARGQESGGVGLRLFTFVRLVVGKERCHYVEGLLLDLVGVSIRQH